jgi:hypothetical protein
MTLWAAAESSARFSLVEEMPPVLESDVQKNDPDTPVISPVDYTREGNDFLIKQTAALSGGDAWVKIVNDWIEPITAPDGSAPDVRPDQMMFVQVKGDVKFASPGQPPQAVQEGQIYPGSGMVTTGEKSSLAVFVGGLNSIRIGPKTGISIEYQIFGPFRSQPSGPSTQRRTTLIRVDAGLVSCKVGYETGVTQYVEVRADNGSAIASSGDFMVSVSRERFEAAAARGSVRVTDGNRKDVAVLVVSKTSGLQLARTPPVSGQLAQMTADTRFLTEMVDFVNAVNSHASVLLGRQARGETLSESETGYLEKLPIFFYLRRVRASTGK